MRTLEQATDSTGAAIVEIAPSAYQVFATHPELGRTSAASIEGVADQRSTCRIAFMDTTRTVRVKVVDRDGNPVEPGPRRYVSISLPAPCMKWNGRWGRR